MCECMENAGVSLDSEPSFGMYDLGPLAVGNGSLISPIVDENKMSASVVIMTDAIDRQRERIMPDGLDITSYRSNPVVLWEHGLDPNVPFPVGKSKSRSGEITVKPIANGWEATCFFSQTSKLGYEVFGLVAEDIVRSASIQALPRPGYVTRDYDADGNPFVVINKAELVEWSWTRMGVNQEAVRKTLSRGRVGGARLSDVLVKSLMAVLPPRRVWSPGARFKSASRLKTGTGMPKMPGTSQAKTPAAPKVPKAPRAPSFSSHLESSMRDAGMPDDAVRSVMSSRDPELALNDVAYGVVGSPHADSAARAYESYRKIKRKSGGGEVMTTADCPCNAGNPRDRYRLKLK